VISVNLVLSPRIFVFVFIFKLFKFVRKMFGLNLSIKSISAVLNLHSDEV